MLYYLFLYFESQISYIVSYFRTIKFFCSNNALSPRSVGTSPFLKRVGGFHSSYFELGKEGMLGTKLNDIIEFHPITSHAGTEGEQRYSSTHSLTLTLIGVGWSTLRPIALSRKRDPVPIVQEAPWVQETSWTVAKNLTFTRVQISCHSVGNESQYQLHYLGQQIISTPHTLHTFELGYNDLSLCNTLAITSHILWLQVILHKACVFLPCLVRHT